MYKPAKAIMVMLTLALFLGACLPAASGQPPAAQPQAQNTQGSVDVQSEINTAVAQTLEAHNQVSTFVAQTMEAQPTLVPSSTPFSIPTFTPFVVPTATLRPTGGGGGGSGGSGGGSGSGGAGAPQYDCALVNQKPRDGDRIWHPGDEFDVEWTLKNTGTKTIAAGYPFMHIGGTDMSPTGELISAAPIEPGDTFSFRIEIVAPEVSGPEKQQFTMQWAFIVEGNKICKPYISIFVQRR